MIAVISPAKTFADHRCVFETHTSPQFIDESAKLMTYLRKIGTQDLCELMKVSVAIGKLNVERYKRWRKSPRPEVANPSIFAFRGDVYRSINIETLNEKDILFAQNHLRILSGLYGLLKPLDLIQEYRLEMGTRLATKYGKTLYQFWGDKITAELNRELAKEKSPTLINLASNEYFKVLDADQIKARMITPIFKEKKKGVYKVIGINAKRARGLMSRYIIKKRLRNPQQLKKFDLGGYTYREKLSDDSQWVFTSA